jgi:hypothetical protein
MGTDRGREVAGVGASEAIAGGGAWRAAFISGSTGFGSAGPGAAGFGFTGLGSTAVATAGVAARAPFSRALLACEAASFGPSGDIASMRCTAYAPATSITAATANRNCPGLTKRQ